MPLHIFRHAVGVLHAARSVAQFGLGATLRLLKAFSSVKFQIVLLTLNWCLLRAAKRAEKRARRCAAIKTIQHGSKNDPELLRTILGNLPAYVKFDQYERSEWLNHTFVQLWPWFDRTVSGAIKFHLEPIVRENLPQALAGFTFEKLSFGSEPLWQGGVKAVEVMNEDEIVVVLDVDVKWVAAPDIVMRLTPTSRWRLTSALDMTPVMYLKVDTLFVAGPLRLTFGPLQAEGPLFKGVKISFLEKPDIDFTFKVLGGADIMSLPALSDWLTTLVMQDLMTRFVYPEYHWAGFDDDDHPQNELSAPIGIVTVTLYSAVLPPRKVRRRDSVFAACMIRPDTGVDPSLIGDMQSARTAFGRGDTTAPQWSTTIHLAVFDPSQVLQLFVAKTNKSRDHKAHSTPAADDVIIGTVKLPLRRLVRNRRPARRDAPTFKPPHALQPSTSTAVDNGNNNDVIVTTQHHGDQNDNGDNHGNHNGDDDDGGDASDVDDASDDSGDDVIDGDVSAATADKEQPSARSDEKVMLRGSDAAQATARGRNPHLSLRNKLKQRMKKGFYKPVSPFMAAEQQSTGLAAQHSTDTHHSFDGYAGGSSATASPRTLSSRLSSTAQDTVAAPPSTSTAAGGSSLDTFKTATSAMFSPEYSTSFDSSINSLTAHTASAPAAANVELTAALEAANSTSSGGSPVAARDVAVRRASSDDGNALQQITGNLVGKMQDVVHGVAHHVSSAQAAIAQHMTPSERRRSMVRMRSRKRNGRRTDAATDRQVGRIFRTKTGIAPRHSMATPLTDVTEEEEDDDSMLCAMSLHPENAVSSAARTAWQAAKSNIPFLSPRHSAESTHSRASKDMDAREHQGAARIASNDFARFSTAVGSVTDGLQMEDSSEQDDLDHAASHSTTQSGTASVSTRGSSQPSLGSGAVLSPLEHSTGAPEHEGAVSGLDASPAASGSQPLSVTSSVVAAAAAVDGSMAAMHAEEATTELHKGGTGKAVAATAADGGAWVLLERCSTAVRQDNDVIDVLQGPVWRPTWSAVESAVERNIASRTRRIADALVRVFRRPRAGAVTSHATRDVDAVDAHDATAATTTTTQTIMTTITEFATTTPLTAISKIGKTLFSHPAADYPTDTSDIEIDSVAVNGGSLDAVPDTSMLSSTASQSVHVHFADQPIVIEDRQQDAVSEEHAVLDAAQQATAGTTEATASVATTLDQQTEAKLRRQVGVVHVHTQYTPLLHTLPQQHHNGGDAAQHDARFGVLACTLQHVVIGRVKLQRPIVVIALQHKGATEQLRRSGMRERWGAGKQSLQGCLLEINEIFTFPLQQTHERSVGDLELDITVIEVNTKYVSQVWEYWTSPSVGTLAKYGTVVAETSFPLRDVLRGSLRKPHQSQWRLWRPHTLPQQTTDSATTSGTAGTQRSARSLSADADEVPLAKEPQPPQPSPYDGTSGGLPRSARHPAGQVAMQFMWLPAAS